MDLFVRHVHFWFWLASWAPLINKSKTLYCLVIQIVETFLLCFSTSYVGFGLTSIRHTNEVAFLKLCWKFLTSINVCASFIRPKVTRNHDFINY